MTDSRIGLRKTQDKPGTVVVPERKYSREKKMHACQMDPEANLKEPQCPKMEKSSK